MSVTNMQLMYTQKTKGRTVLVLKNYNIHISGQIKIYCPVIPGVNKLLYSVKMNQYTSEVWKFDEGIYPHPKKKKI
jgi:hypothetical protein